MNSCVIGWFMWRDIFRIVKKLAVLIVPFFIILPVYCWAFPMYYMDDEYAMYKQQRDYCNTPVADGEQDNDVVIFGDSRAKAGFVPELLPGNTYNLALGGATPIEGYYSLKEYLENHEKPKTVILAYAPMHYMDVDTLWTRTVYFHNIEHEDFFEILDTAKEYEKTEKILIDNYMVEYFMYKFYMPNKYATALKNAGFVFRHKKTVEKYEDMIAKKGHTFYGTEEYSSGVNWEAHEMDFVVSDVIDVYLRKMIELCQEQGIKVIIEQLPMNETSYGILQPDFKTHYKEYMMGLAEAYPEVSVAIKPYCYNNEYFGDADHLNEKGCRVFSQYIATEVLGETQ